MHQRLVSIDFERGIAIIWVIFVHTVIYSLPLHGGGVPIDPSTKLYSDIFTYFTAWAGIFAIISGIGNTLSLYGGLKSGNVKDPKQIAYSAIFSGGIIIFFNYIYLFIFCPGGFIETGIYRGGFLPALITYGQFLPAEPSHYLFSTTFIMIGWSTLLSGVILYVLLRNEGYKKRKRNYIILGFLGTLCILIYPLFDSLTYDLLKQDTNLLNVIPQLIIGWIVGPMDPILPYFGFALYGIIFGFMFVEGVEKRQIIRYGIGLGVLYTTLGTILIIIFGYELISYDTPFLPVLLLILGPMLLYLIFIMYRIDLRGDEKKLAWVKRSKLVRRFGSVSLTIFILEGSMVQILRIPFLLIPEFDTAFLLILFGLPTINLIIWAIILKYWEKIDYKYSFEWFIIKLRKKITKKESNRLSATKNQDTYVRQVVVH